MRIWTTLAASAIAAAAASAETITQTIDFNWGLETGLEIGSFAGFDNAGGTRQLTGVSLSVDGSARWDVTVLNYSSATLGADAWFADGLANFNVLLGEFGPNSVERYAGVVQFNGLTGFLSAGDPGSGEPGSPGVSGSFTGLLAGFFDLEAADFGVFQNGVVEARLLGFTDAYVDGPNGSPPDLLVDTDLLSAGGRVTLTYTYALVPAPAGLALLGAVVPLAVRRRR